MRKSKWRILLLGAALAVFAIWAAACKPEEVKEPTPVYAVSFETDGGTQLPVQGVTKGGKVVRPADPEKRGYDLAGWFKDAESLTAAWNFESDTVSADTTLYAKWSLKAVSSDERFYYGYAGEDTTYTVWAKEALSGTVVIPAEHEGVAVTAIAEGGFEGSALETLVLPESIASVGRYAFRGCEQLSVVAGGEGVASVGSYAFQGTAWMKNMPDGVAYLGKAVCGYKGRPGDIVYLREGTLSVAGCAFYGVAGLGRVAFPASLASIGNYAFAETGLKEVEVPSNVFVGDGAFRDTPNLEQVKVASGVTHLGSYTFAYSGVREVIYDAADCETNATFAYCDKLEKVTIGDSAVRFPENMFPGCTAVAEVSVGSGATEIPASAFADNGGSLARLTLGKNVQKIGDFAFRGASLTEVTVPEKVTSMGRGCFMDCKKLMYAVVEAENLTYAGTTLYSSFKGCDRMNSVVFAGKAKSVPADMFNGVEQLKSVDFGESMETIGNSAFAGSGLAGTLVLPDSVKRVGDGAFEGLDNLRKVVLGTGLENIGAGAFAKNPVLASVSYNAADCTAEYNSSYSALFPDSALTGVELGEGVVSIAEAAFKGQELLTGVELDGVKRIGASCFSGCKALARVVKYDGLEYIGPDAFKDTTWHTGFLNMSLNGPVYVGKVLYAYKGDLPEDGVVTVKAGTASIAGSAFAGKSTLTKVVLPDSIRTIGDRAFSSCSKLVEINLPEGLTAIGMQAFNYCSSLREASFYEGLLEIGASAFSGCSALTSVVLPDSLVKLGASAFSSCPNLAELTLSGSLREIPNNAFQNSVGKLTQLTLPDGVERIGTYAFYGLGVEKLALPSALTAIDNYAFSGGKFNDIAWGTQVERIGAYAFNNCSELTKVEMPGTVTELGANAFSYCTKLAEAILPDSIKELKANTFDNCKALASIRMPAELETIEGLVFQQTPLLKEIEIPGTVAKLGSGAFQQATGLESAVIPSGIETVADALFRECGNLRSVTLPDGITAIGENAFLRCGKLGSITIPDSVTSIGKNAFFSCTQLVSIVLPEKVGEIFDNTIGSCTNLKTVIMKSPEVVKVKSPSYLPAGAKYYVPARLVESYQADTANKWNERADSIFADSAVKDDFVIIDGTLINYIGANQEVTIPKEITSVAAGAIPSFVTAISVEAGNTAFACQDGVLFNADKTELLRYPAGREGETYTVPTAVTKLANYAFEGSLNLTGINLSGVNDLGIYLFKGCTNLSEVTLSNSLTAIPEGAFYQCANLDGLQLPEGLTAIGAYAFYSAVTTSEQKWSSLPSTLQTIGASAFQSGKFQDNTLRLPASVTDIASMAFSSTGLTHIYLEGSVPPTIQAGSFTYSSAYFFVPDAEALAAYTEAWPAAYAARLFTSDMVRGDYLVKDGTMVGYLGSDEVVVIPDYVTALGNSAFANNKTLKEITIGAQVVSLGTYVFQNCTNLATVHYNAVDCTVAAQSYNSPFSGLYNLKTFEFGEGVKSIPANLLYNMSGLKELTIPAGVERIGKGAFGSLGALAKLNFNATQAAIESGAFSNLGSLNNVTIGANVKSVSDDAFKGIYAIKQLVFAPGSVLESIGANAFNGCWQMSGVVFGDSLKSIGEKAFYGCNGITEITLPASVTSVGKQAFYSMSKLVKVTFLANDPSGLTLAESLFTVKPALEIFVPETAVEAYKEALPAYADNIKAILAEPEPVQ